MSEAPQVHGLPPPQAPPPKLSTATLAALAALVLAALGFMTFGLGYALGWWGPEADAPTSTDAVAEAAPPPTEAEPPPAEIYGAEPIPLADPASDPLPTDISDDPLYGAEPVPEVPADTGARSTGEASSGRSGSSRGGSGGPTAGSGPRVAVVLTPVHYDHVDVRLGGTVFGLDGANTIKIRPGTYRVELRKTADAPWKPAGRISVEFGERYRVQLFDPPLLKLTVLSD